jgi:predicted transglutaminase-like cysteine proteinase
LAIAAGFGILVSALATPTKAQGAFLPVRKAISAPIGALGLCRDYGWACAGEGALPTRAQVEIAAEVSRQVNAGVHGVADAAQYGTEERWSLPSVRAATART